MKKQRLKIYVLADIQRNIIQYTGIDFVEFLQLLPQPLENILILKGECLGNGHANHFELVEGQQEVQEIAKSSDLRFGDFCFVDYFEKGIAKQLKKQEIAELLYLAHMSEPLETAFFPILKNRFVYLSHDDGWYCKLFCQDVYNFAEILCRKITGKSKAPTPVDIQKYLLEAAREGIIIDLSERNADGIPIYTVGSYSNPDEVLTHWQTLKMHSKKRGRLPI